MKICPSEWKPGILHEQAKLQKPVKGNYLSSHAILLELGKPTNDLANFLVSILKPLTKNKYTDHHSFSWAGEI